MERKMADHFRLMTAMTILLAGVLLVVMKPSEAAFPGTNGRIVFASGQELSGGAVGDTDIFTMNPDGTEPAQLTGGNGLATDDAPTFSPDGREIAFVRETGLYVMNADGSAQRRLSVSIAEPALAHPVWSPDGEKIAYVCNPESGNRDICKVNVDGTGLVRITSHPKDEIEPTWSPDGTRIAFASTRYEAPGTQNYDVFTMHADGTSPTNITSRPGNDIQPDWSPDGRRIAFASHYSASGFFADREIWTINADGTSPARLTDDASAGPGFAAASHPAYSPDGTKIAYESPLPGNPEIFAMNSDGTGRTQITNNSVYDGNPDWQPLNADLTLTKTGSPDTATAGQDLTYTLTATNIGPATAKNTVLTDPLPASTTFVSASAGCTELDNTVTCDLGDLTDGDTATATITVRPTVAAPSGIGNTASVSSETTDPRAANNSATEHTAVNHPPDAADDAATTNEDSLATVNVLSNDADPDGDPISLTTSTQPSHGSASCLSTGECTYTPDTDYNGADSFTCSTSDGRGGTDTGTVDIMVNAVNDPPVADDQAATTSEDTPEDMTLAASDVDGDALTYGIVRGPAHGTLSGTGETRTYTPDPDYVGSDSFTFRANDGVEDSNIATITIEVDAVNDAPAIEGVLPVPGSTTRDRTPRIEATVRDVETEMTRSLISLYLDGRPRSFAYDPATDRLTFTPRMLLFYGGHTVRIVARERAGLSTTETWRFRVVRRR